MLWLVNVNGSLAAVSHDGSLTAFARDGKPVASKPLAAAELQEVVKQAAGAQTDPRVADALKSQSRPDRMGKLVAGGAERTAIAYWGGTLRIVDAQGAIRCEQQLPQDITALVWLDRTLVAGLADGRLIALRIDP